MKKLIAFLLLSCIIITTFACAGVVNDTSSVTFTQTEEISTEEPRPELPDADYGGYLFTVASTSENTTFDTWRFDYEEQTGDVIEDAFFTRNMSIEEKYKIKFAAETVPISSVSKAVKAGDDAYDIVFERALNLPSVISGGYLTTLDEIPYLDLGQNFWDKNSVEDLSVANKTYMAAGDIHLSSFDCTWTLYFDKILINEYKLQSPYDLIDSNGWTLDAFYDLCKSASNDLNGDGKMDVNDFWGFSTHQGTYPGLMTAVGEKFISKDKDGIPYLTMNTDKFYTAYQKILLLMHGDNATYEQIAQMGSFSKNEQCNIFIEDRSIFFSEVMNIITTMLRDKKNDYGVVPWPKYEPEQDRYYNYVNEAAAMLVIPKTASDTERTGVIVQVMAYESSKTIRPAYYEIAIVDKYSRDDKMGEMMDLIFSNRTYELAFVYGWGGFANAFYKLAVDNNSDLASMTAVYETKVTEAIDKFISDLKSNT